MMWSQCNLYVNKELKIIPIVCEYLGKTYTLQESVVKC